MQRRDFLRIVAGAPAALALAGDIAPWRSFEVTTTVEVLRPRGATRIWIPLPMNLKAPAQRVTAQRFEADGGRCKTMALELGRSRLLMATFAAGERPRLVTSARVTTIDWRVDVGAPPVLHRSGQGGEAELAEYLRPTQWMPLGGIARTKAAEITDGAASDVAKARAIYEWVVQNTRRDPNTQGCGRGDVASMLRTGTYTGKCADINALFVCLARAAGIPARDAYGLRLGPSKLGYHSLGTSSEIVTKAQHCRAEVYLREYGWVPVDPADVRKVVLEEPPGNRQLADEMVTSARARLFGSWEMNWMAYNYAQDVALPGSSGPPLHFLMYPQAETADGRLDSLDPANFRYEIRAQEITRS